MCDYGSYCFIFAEPKNITNPSWMPIKKKLILVTYALYIVQKPEVCKPV